MTVFFTSEATAKNGRDGHVKSSTGSIDVNLGNPKPNETPDGSKSNPEELFASGYAACYDGALNLMAKKAGHKIDSTTTAKVSLQSDDENDGFKISVILVVDIKGVSQQVGEELTAKAHEFCPYSKATRGNIDVEIITQAQN